MKEKQKWKNNISGRAFGSVSSCGVQNSFAEDEVRTCLLQEF